MLRLVLSYYVLRDQGQPTVVERHRHEHSVNSGQTLCARSMHAMSWRVHVCSALFACLHVHVPACLPAMHACHVRHVARLLPGLSLCRSPGAWFGFWMAHLFLSA
jgi:hypothetical protein